MDNTWFFLHCFRWQFHDFVELCSSHCAEIHCANSVSNLNSFHIHINRLHLAICFRSRHKFLLCSCYRIKRQRACKNIRENLFYIRSMMIKLYEWRKNMRFSLFILLFCCCWSIRLLLALPLSVFLFSLLLSCLFVQVEVFVDISFNCFCLFHFRLFTLHHSFVCLWVLYLKKLSSALPNEKRLTN